MPACSEVNEGGRWSLGFRPFMHLTCKHIAGSEASGGVTSLDSTSIDPALFEALAPHGSSSSCGSRGGSVDEDEIPPHGAKASDAYLSPSPVHELVAVGFDDGSVLVFKEHTTSFSAHGE
jgi:hypothetical protein